MDNLTRPGLLLGGDKHTFGDLFYQPTILTGVKKGMDCFEEEIFGPVVSVLRFDREEEAIAIANDCNMGLAAYFFSRDVNQGCIHFLLLIRKHRSSSELNYANLLSTVVILLIYWVALRLVGRVFVCLLLELAP